MAAAGAPATKVTAGVALSATGLVAPTAALMVLVSALVEAMDPLHAPLALVRPGCKRVLPVPVALTVTFAPWTGFP